MVGTGANRMPLTKIHPILLGKQKAEGTSLLAQHRQQFEERRQDHHQQMGYNQPMSGHHQPPTQMQGSLGSPLPPNYGHGQAYPPQPLGYGMYQHIPYPPPTGQPAQPPPPGYGPPAQPPPPPSDCFELNSSSRTYNHKSHERKGDGRDSSREQGREYREKHSSHDSREKEKSGHDRSDGGDRNGRSSIVDSSSENAPTKRKRKSRWGAADDKAIITGPTTLPANITEEQRKQYLLQFKIEEITQKLRTGELGIPLDPGDRSPSPEPIYNSEGKRLNTREFRVRKALEEERHILIKQAVEEIPSYKPPIDYKPPTAKICDKVFIPAERNPAVNFIGLLIGPRGNTLKRLEKETGCKIIIRGKGSVKEGKVGRIPGQLMPGEDEPLHALITGPTDAEVKKGVQVVSDIVKEGIECPDAANELRRNQLRELAELNGTLIDDEVVKCKNCGATDHRHWECTEKKNVTSEISCNKCGGYGHVAADCKVNLECETAAPVQTFSEKAKMDTEYMSLMAELGVDAPPQPPKRVFRESPASSTGAESSILSSPVKSSDNAGGQSFKNNSALLESPKGGGKSNQGSTKWASSSSAPQSLMDINLGPTSSMTKPNRFNIPRSDGVRPDGVRGSHPDMMQGTRQDGMRGMRLNVGQDMPPSWRNNRPTPLMQAQTGPVGGNAIPPWQQIGPNRGPPPNANFRMPVSNVTGYGPPPNAVGSASVGAQPGSTPPVPMGFPNRWAQPYGNFNQMPPNSYGSMPPPWVQQPPPPPPPPES